MTYLNAKKYILSLPTEAPEQPSGKRLKRLLECLGNPQKGLRYVTLTGSNGKSVCAEMLLSVYKGTSYRVGGFFSENLKEPRLSIRIGEEPLSMALTAELIVEIRRAVAEMNASAEQTEDGESTPILPTRSELFLCLGLLAFRRAGCHFVLMESDPHSIDVIRHLPSPLGAVICGAIPHEDPTEMQGIRASIRHGIREIVSAPQNRESHTLIANTCANVQCRLTVPARSQIEIGKMTLRSTEFTYQGKSYRLGLCGKFQVTNATVTLETLSMLGRMGFPVTDAQREEGLANVSIPARFEVLSSSPTIIADSTHVGVAIGTVLESLADFRSMIGSTIRLLLPDGDLVDPYVRTLTDMGYDVKKVILLSDRRDSDGILFRFSKKKDAIRASLDSLPATEILLISGPAEFTEEIRYDLLQVLGF